MKLLKFKLTVLLEKHLGIHVKYPILKNLHSFSERWSRILDLQLAGVQASISSPLPTAIDRLFDLLKQANHGFNLLSACRLSSIPFIQTASMIGGIQNRYQYVRLYASVVRCSRGTVNTIHADGIQTVRYCCGVDMRLTADVKRVDRHKEAATHSHDKLYFVVASIVMPNADMSTSIRQHLRVRLHFEDVILHMTVQATAPLTCRYVSPEYRCVSCAP